MRLRAGLLGGLVALALAAPATASGDTRYAAPSGSGPEPCLESNPCDIETAVEDAPANDFVSLATGIYNLTGNLEIAEDITVGGTPGRASETVIASTAPIAVTVVFASTNSVIRDLRISHSDSSDGSIGLELLAGFADRVEVVTSGGDNACFVAAQMRSSICRNDSIGGGGGVALYGPGTATGELVNVTAISTGAGGSGLFVNATAMGADIALEGLNVIADGDFDQRGLAVGGSQADIDLAYSIFDDAALLFTAPATGTPTAENDNVSSATFPLDLDATGRQLPGSGSIDRGDPTALPLPGGDIDGEARVQNGVVDIGAEESDGVDPNTTITKKPPKKTRKRKATFRFRSNEPGARFDCKLDRKPYRPCDSGKFTARNLKRKRHVFKVRADDGFNRDPSPATHRWKVLSKKR